MRLAGILSVAAILAGCQTTPTHKQVSKTALAGSTISLGHFSQINPDCSNVGFTSGRVTAAPAHGRVEFRRQTDFPSFAADNVRAKCNLTRVPGVGLYYTPDRNYSGPDSFTAAFFWVDGEVWTRNVTVDVR